MITTAIVKEINISSGNSINNKYKIEIPLFKTPETSNPNTYTFVANACVQNGFSSCYKIGDLVYVSFMNNDYSYPIIMGKIYQGISTDPRSYACLDKLEVANGVTLPTNTTIGKINYNNIYTLFLKQQKLDELIVEESKYTHNLILSSNNLYFMFTFVSKESESYSSLDKLKEDFKNKFSNNVQIAFQKETIDEKEIYSIISGIYMENNVLAALDKSEGTNIVTIDKIVSDTVSN